MAQAQVTQSVVLLEGVPPYSKTTDTQTQQKALIQHGYSKGLSNIESACLIMEARDAGTRSGAVYKLYGKAEKLPKSAHLLYWLHFPGEIKFPSALLSREFCAAISTHSHLTQIPSELNEHTFSCIGQFESLAVFFDLLNERLAQLMLSDDKNSKLLESEKSEVSSAQSVYDQMSPDALALLEKLPTGRIPGVYYDSRAGRVLIDKTTEEEEERRISSFQNAYQSVISGRKLKIVEVPIPPALPADAVTNLACQYNLTYDQCVFLVQQETPVIRVVSTSSRQLDQAKTLLPKDLANAVRVEIPSNKCEVIRLSNTHTLTLKKADIVKEDVHIIVNPANSRLQHAGGVAAALNKASKGQLQKFSNRHVQQKGFVPPGCVAITSGGGALKCSKVIHAVGPEKLLHGEDECQRLLRSVVNDALARAEKYDAHSIAFPAISSGIFGVSKELVSECLVDTIITYHFNKPPPILTDIRIVIIDEATFVPFAKYFRQKQKAVASEHKQLVQPAKFNPQSKKSKITLTSSPPSESDDKKSLSPPEDVQNAERKLSVTDATKIEAILKGLTNNWRTLGNALGFTKAELDAISAIQADTTVFLNKLVIQWLSCSQPTLAVLLNALHSIEGTKDYVAEILKAFDEQQPDSKAVQPSGKSEDQTDINYPLEVQDTTVPDVVTSSSSSSHSINQTEKELEDIKKSGLSKSDHHSNPDTAITSSPGSLNPGAPTQMAVTTSTAAVTAAAIPATSSVSTGPIQPPPGLPSHFNYSTPSSDNHGQPWGYPIEQNGGIQNPINSMGDPTGQSPLHGPGVTQTGSWHPNIRAPGASHYQFSNTWGAFRGQGNLPPNMAQRPPTPNLQGAKSNGLYQEQGAIAAGVGDFQCGAGGMAAGMSFSQAVGGATLGNVVTTQPHPGVQQHATGADHSGDKRHKSQPDKDEKKECPICLTDFNNPVKTKCGHDFCRGCINRALQSSSYCPTCKTVLRTITGTQPVGGQMTVQRYRNTLPGYSDCGTIEIHYDIPNGVQGPEHPNPGRRYHGTQRTAYLPDNHEGREVLKLLEKAFNARLIFTVGTSVTSGQSDVVTWNDIHHKTRTYGGAQNYGYPDPTYLQRVKADLAAKGIV